MARVRWFCGVLVFVLAASSASQAQELAAKPAGKVADTKFWLVGAALNTAMILDTKSTFDVAGRCATCYEANKVVAPFVAQGPAVTFVAGELFDAGVMAVSAKMKGSSKAWVRHIWWVAPVAIAAGHVAAYRHNVNVR
ncbi:MAG TPA: hypothetical protein VLT86_01515 [Vicinamibacterales bacterium]|nr:hypothetical protein [Vicinamibacterales bacterium]